MTVIGQTTRYRKMLEATSKKCTRLDSTWQFQQQMLEVLSLYFAHEYHMPLYSQEYYQNIDISFT